MAKQNFLNGSYIGKLGDTVGQRWKDQHIIRSYVKPQNPKTPAQEANRQLFATANRLAQEAMNINGHTGVWDTSTKPEYAQRVGQAMRRLLLGYSEQDSLPLYPEGQAPSTKVILTGYTYNGGEAKYTFSTQGFGNNTPATAVLSFYSPLFYLNGAFTANTIHATVNSQAMTFDVDLSAQNILDTQDVKTKFQQAMDMGFVALKATFYDNIGAVLNNISIQRKYAVTGKLYDFDESLSIIETTDNVVLTQAFTGSIINGAISAVNQSGFPIVYNVSARNTYYKGLAEETLVSNFITQENQQEKQFTLLSGSQNGYLETTNITTYAVTTGATQPRIYKDTSTKAYEEPVTKLVLQDIVFAQNSTQLVLNGIPTENNVDHATIDITYLKVNAGILTKTIMQQDLLAAELATDTITIQDTNCKFLYGGFIGDISIKMYDVGNQELRDVQPDTPDFISGKFFKTSLTLSTNITVTPSLVSMKAIDNTVNITAESNGAFAQDGTIMGIVEVEYKDGTTEIFKPNAFYNGTISTTKIYTATGFDSTKEIVKGTIYLVYYYKEQTTEYFQGNSGTISIQSEYVVQDAEIQDMGYEVTFTLPEILAVNTGKIDYWLYSALGGDGARESDEYEWLDITSENVTMDISAVYDQDNYDQGVPLGMDLGLFYKDGTAVTTTNLKVYTPAGQIERKVSTSFDGAQAAITAARANTQTNGEVTLTFTADTIFPTATPVYCSMQEIYDEAADPVISITSRNVTRLSDNSVKLIGIVQQAGANIDVDRFTLPVFWAGDQETLKVYTIQR